MFVLIHLAYGGAEVQVVELAAALRRRGWDARIVALSPPSGLEARADAVGVPHEHLGMPLRSRSPRVVARLIRAVRRLRPDVLHSHTLPANLIARVARPFTGVPVMVTTAHSVHEGGRRRMAAYRLTDRLTDLTTNVSPQGVERYVRIGAVPAHRLRWVRNGVDLARFAPDEGRRAAVRAALGLPDDTFFWLAVGRHFEPKDYPNLFAATARLRRDRPWVLWVVGDGDALEAHRALVASAGQDDRVKLVGRRTDVDDLMKAADGYVLSSAWEGLPIVLLEAAASGLPIVSTDVGGTREIVAVPDGGALVPAKDPAALAAAMEALRSTPAAARAEMGRAGRARALARFGMDAVADEWIALYEGLLARR